MTLVYYFSERLSHSLRWLLRFARFNYCRFLLHYQVKEEQANEKGEKKFLTNEEASERAKRTCQLDEERSTAVTDL